ncbi:glycogen/starch synthase [Desulforhopalus vacuolatus]|nr:glycogen/starch synthase [Desulforhopalus vacuolatus]
MVSREYGELAGAGGVKDVVFQLAKALARSGKRRVSVVLPRYGFMAPEAEGFQSVMDPLCPYQELALSIQMNLPKQRMCEGVRFYVKEENGVKIYLIEGERFREKHNVYTYTDEEEKSVAWKKASEGHADYFAMNVLLQKAALELLIALCVRPSIIHCHDGHTALLPAMIREIAGYKTYFRGTAAVVTVHNAGRGYHQEITDLPFAAAVSGLPPQVIDGNRLENKFDPLLVASSYSLVNTVSENYARELMDTDSDYMTGWFGHTLKARNIVLHGITNGIDPELYNPESFAGGDPDFIYDPANKEDNLHGKARCRRELLLMLEHGLHGTLHQHGTLAQLENATIFTFVGRINNDKGVDSLIAVLPTLLQRHPDCQVLLLGDGDVGLEEQLAFHAEQPEFAGRFCFLDGYDSDIGRLIFATGDFFMIPSRFEPCGLTDFIAQLYGNIPIVRHVGGLVKVKDGKTGLAYSGISMESLLDALERAIALSAEERRKIQYQAVQEIYSHYTWDEVMKKYLSFYDESRAQQINCVQK